MNKNVLAAAAVFIAIVGTLLGYCFLRRPTDTRWPPKAPVATIAVTSAPATPPIAPPGAPLVEPVGYRPIAPQSAAEFNAAVPIQSAGPPAAPFRIAADTPTWDRATHCLAQAIYYEARTEPLAGQRAVAQVVLNRVRSPAFPASVCGVVYQGSERSTGCQFTFTCDGSLKREAAGFGWQRALMVAASALRGTVYAPVGHATHYHANYVVPYWAGSMAKIRAIGLHDFYRWPGRWRAATYFSQSYANAEPGEIAHSEALVAGTGSGAASVPVVSPTASPPRLAADAARTTDGKMVIPVIDRSAHTLIPGEKGSTLDPALNRITILRADLQGGKLKPKPLPQVRER